MAINEKQEQERQAFLTHFNTVTSEKIVKYIDSKVLPRSRFIFTQRVRGIQFGYCTNCDESLVTIGADLKEGSEVDCRKCNVKCEVKAHGRKRSKLYYDAYVVYYERSKVNPKAITATGYYVSRNYKNNYVNVKLIIEPRHRYLFEFGKPSKEYSYGHGNWNSYGEATSYFGKGSFSNTGYGNWTKTICSLDSIKKSVKGTPFQYSEWTQYTHGKYSYYTKYNDLIKFFSLFSKYPCIEYLIKLGMKYFVDAKVYGGYPTYGAIKWSGKTIQDTLRITKQQINEIKPFLNKGKLHPLSLRLQQIVKKEQSSIPLDELQILAKRYEEHWDGASRILKYTTIRRFDNYVKKQIEIRKGLITSNNDISHIIICWRDYISNCLKLEIDLKDELHLFPRDVSDAHQRMLVKVNRQADSLFNKKIEKRVATLRKYEFEAHGLFVRPALSSNELIKEGKALVHCVGDYADRYANGSTIILLIRRSSEPEKPYYTMEIKKRIITQARGLKNKSYESDEEVLKFVNQFIKAKLTKPIKKESKAL